MTSIAVTSRSFSSHAALRSELNKHYKHVTFNDSGKTLSGDALIQFLQGHEKAIIGLERLSAQILAHLPALKVISRFGVGLDTLDLDAIKALNIRLAYTAGANKRAVAELVIAFAINLLRHLPRAHSEVQAGIWQQRKGRQLSGQTVGIVGLGSIGSDLAFLLKAFGCHVLIYDVIDHHAFCKQHDIKQVDLDSLLQQASIVSLHLPINESTRNLLDAKRLRQLQPNAILINTARGGLVDEHAVKMMLRDNLLAGAAFDVFAMEPPNDPELLSHPCFFATPHIGGSTEEAIFAMGMAAISGLETAKAVE